MNVILLNKFGTSKIKKEEAVPEPKLELLVYNLLKICDWVDEGRGVVIRRTI